MISSASLFGTQQAEEVLHSRIAGCAGQDAAACSRPGPRTSLQESPTKLTPTVVHHCSSESAGELHFADDITTATRKSSASANRNCRKSLSQYHLHADYRNN